jgi:hypothetical protein
LSGVSKLATSVKTSCCVPPFLALVGQLRLDRELAPVHGSDVLELDALAQVERDCVASGSPPLLGEVWLNLDRSVRVGPNFAAVSLLFV